MDVNRKETHVIIRTMKNSNYKLTIYACFIGYIVQAIVNNFAPLLFVTFENSYGISLSRITMLVTINFLVQLSVDATAVAYVDKIGYRVSIILAHLFSICGLLSMAFLPDILPDKYVALLISVILYAIGGGLIEVLIAPIMESCPSENREKAMSLLHSFYCWGHVGVVLLSTMFFSVFGIINWKIMAVLWSLIPLTNIFLFLKAPMAPLISETEEKISFTDLLRNRLFWLFVLMMICSGASEQSVSQWASSFAEKGLNISKTLGDLFGPMMFAIFMGTSRAFYGRYGDRINQLKFMIFSCVLCIASYLLISLSPDSVLSLLGCALCGLSVGIMWPGTISAAGILRNGGTALYALLALAGDVGCSAGPTVVGFVSSLFNDNLKTGILLAVGFPVILLISLLSYRNVTKE